MRLLVLNESHVLVSVVRRLAPPDVEIEEAPSFEAAWDLLHRRAPDALIANVGPNQFFWDSVRDYCQTHEPPIPVLFESCVHNTAQEAGLGPLGEEAAFIHKPYPLEDLKAQIDRLVRTALETRPATDSRAADDGRTPADAPPSTSENSLET